MARGKPETVPAEKPKVKDPDFYGDRGYKIELEADYTGPDHAVDFAHGVGAMCMLGFSYHRPEWVVNVDGKWQRAKNYKFELFEPLLHYFKFKGAKVTEIPVDEAEKLLEKVRSTPQAFVREEPKEETPKEDKSAKDKKAEKREDKLPHEKD